MKISIASLLLSAFVALTFDSQGEETPAAPTNEWVLHVYDLNPLLKNGKKGEVDLDLKDVHSRALINILKDSTGTANWKADDASIVELNGLIYVTQRESVHARLKQVMSALISELDAQRSKNGGVEAPKAGDDWSLHVYDLRPLAESTQQYENVFAISGRTEKNEDQKVEDTIKETMSLLTDATGPENWTASEAVMHENRGRLFVTQRESIHTRIRQVLAALEKEKKAQVRVQVRIVKSSAVDMAPLSTAELNELVSKAGPGADVNQTQVSCYNGEYVVTFGGREEPYIETFIANTEGGGNVSGVREAAGSPIMEGLSAVLRPLILSDGSVELTLRLVMLDKVSFRKLTSFERMLADSTKVMDLSTVSKDTTAELFRLPSRDASHLSTQVVVPKGKWALAGTFKAPDDEKRLSHVFVSAEVAAP